MPSPSWVRAALGGLLLAAATLGACASGSAEPEADATLRVYVSLPLSGPTGRDGQDAADGAELALAEAGGEVDGIAVESLVRDDTEGSAGGWTPAQAAANAREATSDSSAIAYIGDFESGATRASLPITSEARMLQVSPASSAEDLVAPFVGSDELPEVQASTGRTFGRVIPGDAVQGRAAAAWAGDLGWSRVSIESDGTDFGNSLRVGFETAAPAGLSVAREAQRHFLAAASVAGFPYVQYVTAGGPDPSPVLMASDALLSPYGIVPDVFVSRPYLVTSAALDPSHLPPAGQDFIADFEAEYDRPPGRYAAYGYEAMAVVLDSIARAEDPTDRSSVIAAFFATPERETILGDYSIDELGQTTLERVSGYEIEGRGSPNPAILLDAGQLAAGPG